MRGETAQLRAGLDERGIFWIDIPRSDRKRTCWKSTDDQDGYCYFDEDIFGVTELMVTGISAEEVIDATLGPRTCRNDAKPMAQQENDRLKAENAKLQKVCKEMHDHIKDSCDVCDEYYCSSWDEDNECCVFDSYMRELGIEVEA